MNNISFRILGIAPNEAVQKHFYTIAEKYTEIQMDAYISNSFQSIELLKSKDQENYDLIIARGETASMIKKIATIPVIEIPFSQDSILHSIKLAETFHEKYAVVGFPSVTSTAYRLRELLSLELDIYTIHSIDDASHIINQLKQSGYSIIISGLYIDYLIIQHGLKHIGISSNYYDIEAMFKLLLPMIRFYVCQNQQYHFLSDIFRYMENSVLVIHNGEVLFSSIKSLDEQTAVSLAFKAIQAQDGNHCVMEKISHDTLIRTTCFSYTQNGETYYTVTIVTQKLKLSLQKNELLYYSCAEATTLYLKHFNEVFFSSYQFSMSLPQIIASNRPVLLFGEHGTGKEQLAAYIYTQSQFKSHSYIVIDLKVLSERSWSFLLTNTNSPLTSNNCTLFFRGLEELSASRLEHLLYAIRDSSLCTRNRIFFSFSYNRGKNIPNNVLRLQNLLDCISINLVPLRERVDSIPMLVKLYISTLNIEYCKQIIGLSPDAMELLKAYPWEQNLVQFKRVLSQLAEACSSAYINAESVNRTLTNERYTSAPPDTCGLPFDLNRTLYEIEVDIAKTVVAGLGGNQTKAAKQLGICRTTLWKLLNNQ